MSRLAFAVIVHRSDRDRYQVPPFGFLKHFNSRRVQTTVRKHEHYISASNRLVLEKYAGITFSAFQPKKALCSAGPNHVGPHEAHIHQRTKSGEGSVAREHILHRQNRVAAAE